MTINYMIMMGKMYKLLPNSLIFNVHDAKNPVVTFNHDKNRT